MTVVLIRTDASIEIGSGHVMRCLTLADVLRSAGGQVAFLCRVLEGDYIRLIEDQHRFPVYRLPSEGWNTKSGLQEKEIIENWEIDAHHTLKAVKDFGNGMDKIDWMIVDHYTLDKRWEECIRGAARKILVIDDLANRPHDCDMLIDQNLHKDIENRYIDLVPSHCDMRLGPRYALLRPEFNKERSFLRKRDGVVRKVLIFFGGADITNETSKALKAIHALNMTVIGVDVVVGSSNPNKIEIRDLCRKIPGASYFSQVDNMAELMANADLAIGSGGTTTLERCFMGLPTITVTVAQNQVEITETLADLDATRYLGSSENVGTEQITAAILELIKNPEEMLRLGSNALKIIGNFSEDPKTQISNILMEKMDV